MVTLNNNGFPLILALSRRRDRGADRPVQRSCHAVPQAAVVHHHPGHAVRAARHHAEDRRQHPAAGTGPGGTGLVPHHRRWYDGQSSSGRSCSAIVLQIVLTQTRWGTYTIATGANTLGSSEAGIHTRLIRIRAFILTAVLSGVAGVLDGTHISQSFDPNAGGNVLMFLAVASCVIGGTALLGGSGTVIGAFLGALLLGVLQDGFNIRGIERRHLRGRRGDRDPPGHGPQHVPRPVPPRRQGGLTMTQPAGATAASAIPPPAIRAEHIGSLRHCDRADRHQPVGRQGRGLGLIGDNGAGKSTLIKILTGFHKPTSGQLYIDGRGSNLNSVARPAASASRRCSRTSP